MNALHIGVCGFCARQSELFQRFNLLEVQQTFYHPPQLKTVERWRSDAPDHFRFTLKAWQAITHLAASPTYRKSRLTPSERSECGFFRDTPLVRRAWETTHALAQALNADFVVFQCPPQFQASAANIAQMTAFFHWAPRSRARFAWEPRHRSWTPDLIQELCRNLELVHAVDPFYEDALYGVPRYFRLHGAPRGAYRWEYRYQYSDAELADLARKCREQPTYCLFNNDRMCVDAARFAAQIAQSRDGASPRPIEKK